MSVHYLLMHLKTQVGPGGVPASEVQLPTLPQSAALAQGLYSLIRYMIQFFPEILGTRRPQQFLPPPCAGNVTTLCIWREG